MGIIAREMIEMSASRLCGKSLLVVALMTVVPAGIGVGKEVSFLTQNTMLIPQNLEVLGIVKVVKERIPCVAELVEGYDIVGLQEVFDHQAQDEIVGAWYEQVVEEEPQWLDLNNAIFEQEEKVENLGGRGVINIEVNEVEAKIVVDDYLVLGPNSDRSCPPGTGIVGLCGGLAILSRYPIIASSGFVFSDYTYFEGCASKGVLYARIDVCPELEGKGYIHVFNTHIQAHSGGAAARVRRRQFAELRRFIEECTKNGEGVYDGFPIVLMGDLNVVADSDEYRDMLVSLGACPAAVPETRRDTTGMSIFPLNPRKSASSADDTSVSGGLGLADVWAGLRPGEKGCTWIGYDYDASGLSWGAQGNTLATETGGAERIDYFFYRPGQHTVTLRPTSVNLVPASPPESPCVRWKERGRERFSLTVSDHLGVEMRCEMTVP